jgi:hypothetical protein
MISEDFGVQHAGAVEPWGWPTPWAFVGARIILIILTSLFWLAEIFSPSMTGQSGSASPALVEMARWLFRKRGQGFTVVVQANSLR